MSDFKFIECGSKGVHIDASLSEEEQDVYSGFILDMDKERADLKKEIAELKFQINDTVKGKYGLNHYVNEVMKLTGDNREQDKSIQLLAGKLLEAAESLDMEGLSEESDEYKTLAFKYINKEG